MATEYTQGSKAIEEMVGKVVREFHKTLRDAKILVVEASKQPKHQPCKLAMCSPGEYALGYHLRFQYSGEVFENATPAVQAALIDNALAGIKGVERRTREGEEKPRMVYQANRAIPIHPEVIQRRGAILEDWGRAETAFKQMSLPFQERKKKDEPEEAAANG